jgi:uncharacterized protein (TIGR03503 family)
VFLRAVEQEVLVYPTPISLEFEQSRADAPHTLSVIGERATIAPGSISANVNIMDPKSQNWIYTPQVANESQHLTLEIAQEHLVGNHSINTVVYATDLANNRELVFDTATINFGIIETVDVAKAREQQKLAQEQREKEEMLRQIEQRRADDRKRSLIIILVGNIAVLILGLIAAAIIYKRRKKAASEPELQLSAPPS